MEGWKLNMGSTPIITIKRRKSGEPAVPEQFNDELSKELLSMNVKREIVLAGALTFIIAMILTMDLLSLDTQEESMYVSLASYPLHILLLIGSLAFLMITLGQGGII